MGFYEALWKAAPRLGFDPDLIGWVLLPLPSVNPKAASVPKATGDIVDVKTVPQGAVPVTPVSPPKRTQRTTQPATLPTVQTVPKSALPVTDVPTVKRLPPQAKGATEEQFRDLMASRLNIGGCIG